MLNDAVQVAPQLIPVGFDVTLPVPATTTERVGKLNVAVTVVVAVRVKLQVVVVPAEVQAPPHPLNNDVVFAVATIVKAVPDGYDELQVVPLHVTLPVPVPAVVVTVSDTVGGTTLNVAVTGVLVFSVTVQVPVPEQPPPVQPAKVEPAEAEAVSVTTSPPLNVAEQVPPHVMPAGFEVTVPAPVPALVTVSCAVGGS